MLFKCTQFWSLALHLLEVPFSILIVLPPTDVTLKSCYSNNETVFFFNQGLHYSFQTRDKLYFVLDYVNGGEVAMSKLLQPKLWGLHLNCILSRMVKELLCWRRAAFDEPSLTVKMLQNVAYQPEWLILYHQWFSFVVILNLISVFN